VADQTAEEPLQRALGLAWRYLNRRERTVAEVRGRLEREELDEAAVSAAIELLTRDGYLDDQRYARVFTEDKRQLDQWGSERIRRALRERGIAPEAIDQALAAQDQNSELEQALALLRRRFPAPPAERRDRDRALGMMLRKGYDSELALDALAAYTRERSASGA
jgi:regulatory protein